jgi:hypothetical protein
VARFSESYEPEEGVNRGQPNVPAACAHAPISFQMIQKGPEEGGFQNFHRQLRRRLASLLLCKLQEQAKSVPIARDGIGACLPLMHQTIGEKGLQEWRELETGVHRPTSFLFRSKRRDAKRMSSGVAVRYQ